MAFNSKTKSPQTMETMMNVISKYNNWRNYRRTVSALSSLSNRELDDLGLTRGDIQYVARYGR